MHDCLEFKERVFGLAFDELPREQKPGVLAEAENCNSCLEMYMSIAGTLSFFDRAAEAALPPPDYWQSYHEELRGKLEQASRQNGWLGRKAFFADLNRLPVFPRAVLVATVLVILSAGLL